MNGDDNQESALARFEFGRGELRGSTLELFPSRLEHRGVDYFETMPLSHIGAVRAGFERDVDRLFWGGALLVGAIAALAIFRPLQSLVGVALAEVTAQAPGTFLPVSLGVVEFCIGLLPFLGAALALWAAAWIALGWIGRTILTVAVAPWERSFASRGRDPALFEFAETLAGRIADRSDLRAGTQVDARGDARGEVRD